MNHPSTTVYKAMLKEDFEREEWQKHLDNGGRERLAEFARKVEAGSEYRTEPIEERVGNAVYVRFPEPERVSVPEPEFPSAIAGESVAEPCGNGGLAVRPLADSDDGPLYRVENASPFRWLGSARRRFMEISKRETGVCGNPETLQRKREENETLKDQSHRIAGALERAGVSAYREDENNLYVYHVHSGAVQTVPKFRRICFLPYVAARIRAPMVASLEAYLECNPFCRMWTFTNGQRVKTGELRETITAFHRRLSRFSSWLRTQGVEMVFRSTELGTPETGTETRNGNTERDGTGSDREFAGVERDENGDALHHVHSHCLIRLIDGPMSRTAWENLLQAVWRKWGNHWDDGKRVLDARELCKYVFKPGEILSLEDSELVELYHQLKRLKIVAPLGDLREDIKRRKKSKLRLVREPTPDGKVYREVQDWNRHLAGKSQIEKALTNATASGLIDPKESDKPKILAQCLPGFAPGSLVKEPRVMVMAKHWQKKAVDKHRLVAILRHETLLEYRAGVCAAGKIRVHTGTPTVPALQGEMPWMRDVEERHRPPGDPIFEEFPQTDRKPRPLPSPPSDLFSES